MFVYVCVYVCVCVKIVVALFTACADPVVGVRVYSPWVCVWPMGVCVCVEPPFPPPLELCVEPMCVCVCVCSAPIPSSCKLIGTSVVVLFQQTKAILSCGQ